MKFERSAIRALFFLSILLVPFHPILSGERKGTEGKEGGKGGVKTPGKEGGEEDISLPFELKWCMPKEELKARVEGLQENFEDVLETQGTVMKYRGIFNFIFESGKLVFITMRLIEEGKTYDSILKDFTGRFGEGRPSDEEEGLLTWGNLNRTLLSLGRLGMEVTIKYQTDAKNCLPPPEEEPIIINVMEEEPEL